MKSAIYGILGLLACGFVSGACAQAPDDGTVLEKDIPIAVTEVAPGLFFQYHHAESNNAWLVTDDGVLVIDSRQHPKRAEELLANAANEAEFTTLRDQLLGANSILSVTSSLDAKKLDRTSAPATASVEFANEVKKHMAEHKCGYDAAWKAVSKSEMRRRVEEPIAPRMALVK